MATSMEIWQVMVPSKQSEFPGISEVGTLRSEEIASNTLLGWRFPSELCFPQHSVFPVLFHNLRTLPEHSYFGRREGLRKDA